MPVAYFPSLEQAETIEVTFLRPEGGETNLRLLVDSGFTGRSCFVLPESAGDLAQASAPASEATGALHGLQKHIVVTCRISSLSLELSAIAIFADASSLALPPGIGVWWACGSCATFTAGEPSGARMVPGDFCWQPIPRNKTGPARIPEISPSGSCNPPRQSPI